MNCTRCNSPNPPKAVFCTNCGTMLAPEKTGDETVVHDYAPAQASEESFVAPPSVRAEVEATPVPAPRHMVSSDGVDLTPSSMGHRRDTVIVVDRSGSMSEAFSGGRNKMEAAQLAASSMVIATGSKYPHDRIGVVAFNSKAYQAIGLSPLASHKSQIINAIMSLRADNGTDQNEGLQVAHSMFDWSRNDVSFRIIVLTDGKGGDPLATAEDLKSRGVIIEIFGVGDNPSNVNGDLLRRVASTVDGVCQYRFIKDSRTLRQDLTERSNRTGLR